jgi:hypothetical protein
VRAPRAAARCRAPPRAAAAPLPPARLAQRAFEERLLRRLEEVDAAVQGVRADSRKGFEDVTGLVTRMEAKLDRLAEAGGAGGAGGTGSGGAGGVGSPKNPSEEAGAPPALGGRSGGDAGNRQQLARRRLELGLGSEMEGGSSSLEDEEESDRKLLQGLGRKVDQIAEAVGVKAEDVSSGDDEEDRRRLKEKLKSALDKDRQSRTQKNLSDQEKWLEFIFGICEPDVRFGKRGSR